MCGAPVDPYLLETWVEGRSLARGLAPPVPDRGGWRVDTNTEAEVCRWVFPRIAPGIRDIARALDRPGYLIKVCGRAEELRSLLPADWRVEVTGYFMRARDWPEASAKLPTGYRLEVRRHGSVTRAEVVAATGEVAAAGYAAETARAFVYDRIVTGLQHRRRGLGRSLMVSLHGSRRDAALPELLTATEDGRALYQSLGWEVLSPYMTAYIPGF